MNKNKIASLFIATIGGLACAVIMSGTAFSKVTTDIPSDVDEDQLQSVSIVDFDDDKSKGWLLDSRPKKMTKEQQEARNSSAGKKVFGPMVDELAMDIIEGGPIYTAPPKKEGSSGDTGKKNNVLGVVFRFIYPAANEIYLYPPVNEALKKNTNIWEGRGIVMPGRIHQISVWVQGRGYPYSLECIVQDYNGRDHIIRFGSVRYMGWRALKGVIPVDMAQNPESNPKDNTAKLTKFILRADPNADTKELTRRTYFIMDQVKILTETFEVNYDGKDLHQKLDGLVEGKEKDK